MELFLHKSVLLEETVNSVLNDRSGIYVDATLGGGGHALALCGHLTKDALFIGIDQDDDALQAAQEKLKNVSCKKIFVKSNFSFIDEVLDKLDVDVINGIIFDLGVSSYQLDTPDRGFSYMHDGPLDMRMSKEGLFSAEIIVNTYSKEKLADIIWRYGEERWAKRIAEFIVADRAEKSIKTTFELVEIIKKAIPKSARKDGPHPAKRTFQAIRIEVNNEINILKNTFISAANRLKTCGKMGIITFHSLEDRVAKETLKELATDCICPKALPVCVCHHRATLRDVKLIKPSSDEIIENHRARSAKLRIAVKI